MQRGCEVEHMLIDIWHKLTRYGNELKCQWCGRTYAVSREVYRTTLAQEYVCPECERRGITYNTVVLDRPCSSPDQHPRNHSRKNRYHA